MLGAHVEVAVLTIERLPEVVDLHYDAFQGYMNTKLGRRYVNAFLQWFILSDQAIALVAVDEAQAACGYIVGAPVGYEKKLSTDLLWVAMVSVLSRPWLLLDKHFRKTVKNRLKILRSHQNNPQAQTPALPDPIMSLVGIGVAASAHGKGVGRLLMQAFEDWARRRHMASMRLSVYPANLAARKLYEQCGWQAIAIPEKFDQAMYYFKNLT